MLVPFAAPVEIGPDNIWALLLALFLVLAIIGAIAAVILLALKRKTGPARANLEWLSRFRKPFVYIYRGLLTFAGGLGMLVAYRLYADATPGNMQLLPAGIIAMISAGALLSALIPSRTVTGDIEPIDPRLLEKIQVTVERPTQTAFTLSQSEMDLATSLFEQGWDADNVARATVKDYDRLPDEVKDALQSMLQKAVRRSRAT